MSAELSSSPVKKAATTLFEGMRLPAVSQLGKVAALTAALSPYYLATHRNRDKTLGDYPLPEAIRVKETSLPTTQRMEVVKVPPSAQFPTGFQTNEIQVLETKNIDFKKDFKIVTERYTYDKHSDWAPSTWIGHAFSCITKLYFMDYKLGLGLSDKEAKVVLAMLENDSKLNGAYVRVNHNEVFQDVRRLFKDPKVVTRNNLAARVLVGLPSTLLGEMFAELRRGDYYNPMTQTVVLYSDVRGVAAHELGHHKDFQRFPSDWWHSAARALPPVMIYQEYQASARAKDSILSSADRWQYYRYLLPAFLTYLFGAYAISKRELVNMTKKSSTGDENDVTASHVVRKCAVDHGSFLVGLVASQAAIAAGAHPVLGAAVMLGTWLGGKAAAAKILKRIMPYPHEQ
jgi:hypothetical protein